MISDQNTLSYRHGREWSQSHNPNAEEFSRLEAVSAETTVQFEHVVDHQISAINRYIDKMTDELDRIFTGSLFSMISETTDRTGNTVRYSGDMAQDFIDMLTRIELVCDRYGHPTMPSIHAAPALAHLILSELQSQPKDFHQRVEELKVMKEKEAIRREAERINRFRW